MESLGEAYPLIQGLLLRAIDDELDLDQDSFHGEDEGLARLFLLHPLQHFLLVSQAHVFLALRTQQLTAKHSSISATVAKPTRFPVAL